MLRDMKIMSDKIILRNNKSLNSKYFLAPINLGSAVDGSPSENTIKFYKERTGHGIGVTYIGNVAVGSEYCSNSSTLYFNRNLSKWRNLLDNLDNSSILGIQLGCKFSKINGLKLFVNPNVEDYIRQAREEILSFTQKDINTIIKSFVKSARIANKLGFEVVQIHAAHGYFLSLMLSENFNIRSDEYGKDRQLVLKRIIEEIKNNTPDLILDVRLSLYEGIGEQTSEYFATENTVSKIIKYKPDFISISNGIYNINKYYIYPQKELGFAPYLKEVKKLSNIYSDVIWNSADNVWKLIEDKQDCDNLTYSIGRSLIADPLFVEKSLNGLHDTIISCKRCGGCHYYSKDKSSMVCIQNQNF